jgi:threonine dehydratase
MLDKAADARVWVKPEALQLTGSFKIRGALNKVLGLGEQERLNGIAAFFSRQSRVRSRCCCQHRGLPRGDRRSQNAPRIKVGNCRWWGAEVIFYDPATEDRAKISQAIADQRGMTIISPFDDHEIMAGAGTTGLETAEQLVAAGQKPDAVVVNCSGGGLASGVIEAMGHFFPEVEKYIVEPQGYDKMAHSLAAGEVRSNPAVRHTIMDGISGPVAGKLPPEVFCATA